MLEDDTNEEIESQGETSTGWDDIVRPFELFTRLAEEDEDRGDQLDEEKIDLFAAIDAGDLHRLQVGCMSAWWHHDRLYLTTGNEVEFTIMLANNWVHWRACL